MAIADQLQSLTKMFYQLLHSKMIEPITSKFHAHFAIPSVPSLRAELLDPWLYHRRARCTWSMKYSKISNSDDFGHSFWSRRILLIHCHSLIEPNIVISRFLK
jgi:hypothetical protein